MHAQDLRDLAYLVAAVFFIIDLKWMAHPRTAVRGNYLGALGMAIAIAATVLGQPMTWKYVLIGAGVGTPRRLADGVQGQDDLDARDGRHPERLRRWRLGAGRRRGPDLGAAGARRRCRHGPAGGDRDRASALIGSVTFYGSYVAFGKLAEFLAVKWKLKGWQKAVKYGFSAVTALVGLAYGVKVGVMDRWRQRPRQADRLAHRRRLRSSSAGC